MRAAFILEDRSDQELLEGVWAAVTRECEDVAAVIAHLAEMDKRQLFAEEGCSSLANYCMEVLHLSEAQTYPRIDVARVAQKFPIVLEMLADGLVHLTAVRRLGPSLTQENHLGVLEEATYKSMAKVEEIVARLRPKPPVPSRIRKLSSPSPGPEQGEGLFPSNPAVCEVEAEPARPAFSGKPVVSPLAPEIYDVHFIADKETVDALKLLQELLSHQVPNGDPAIIIKDSLLMRLEQLRRQRFGKGKRQRRHPEEAPGNTVTERSESRYIPRHVKKAVWERDQGRCAFVAKNGRRCSERKWIEFHHVKPFAWGGESTVENIQLRCRTHNAYEGELIFGRVTRKNLKSRVAGEPTGFKTSSAGSKRPGAGNDQANWF